VRRSHRRKGLGMKFERQRVRPKKGNLMGGEKGGKTHTIGVPKRADEEFKRDCSGRMRVNLHRFVGGVTIMKSLTIWLKDGLVKG